MELSGVEFTERELIARVMRALVPVRRKQYRWVRVKEVFCCGSGVAYALCNEFGYDPDEILKA